MRACERGHKPPPLWHRVGTSPEPGAAAGHGRAYHRISGPVRVRIRGASGA